jgi:hypothetical protein
VLLRVKGGNPGENGRLGSLWEIFVAFDTNRNANLGFPRGVRIGRRGCPDHSQDATTAADGHTFAQGDLRGHAKCEFDFGAFGKWSVRKKEDSARADILRESNALQMGRGLADGEWKKVRKTLSSTAFNLNRRSGHSGVLPWPIRTCRSPNPDAYFSAGQTIRKDPSSQGTLPHPDTILSSDLDQVQSRKCRKLRPAFGKIKGRVSLRPAERMGTI